MLNILGSPRRLCDGLPRRQFLQAGGLSLLGLGWPRGLTAGEAAPSDERNAFPSFGRAKACILLYLYGSPSQLETFDVKPEAPLEIRGELKSIPSSVLGYHVGELLPKVAQVIDRATVVRSMTHPYPIHGIAYATSGIPDPQGTLEVEPRDEKHWPFIGSVVDYLEERNSGPARNSPRNLALPFPLSSRRSGQPFRAGPYGGFLGAGYDPIWTEFEGEGTQTFTQSNRGVVQVFRDPYGGIRPDGRFKLASSAAHDDGAVLDRLDGRRSLLGQLEAERRRLDRVASGGTAAGGGFDRFQEMAFSLLDSRGLREALDIRREEISLREQYGMTLYGQGSLIARRLVEAGCKFVSLFWDEYGLADSAWDTHYQHYKRMKDELCPTFDRSYSALILDLEDRGLLDETLVVCISEHGRTPELDSKADGVGRHHWSRAYSAIFAGGGFARGRIVGKTDRTAGDVVDTPISPKDVLATVYHLLGYGPHTLIHDRLNRPYPIAGEGRVRPELLA